ncbi:infA [Symbiodinium microadriaticum]|nr:infA [Symbiodinium microadriaticum]
MVASRISRQAKAVGGPKGRRKDTKKQVQVQKERKKRDNVIELEGKVLVHSRNIFKVLLSNGAEVQCTLAGKLRMNNIKVMEGDAVTVEMSPFDLTKGRIVFRTIKFPGEDEEDA